MRLKQAESVLPVEVKPGASGGRFTQPIPHLIRGIQTAQITSHSGGKEDGQTSANETDDKGRIVCPVDLVQ